MSRLLPLCLLVPTVALFSCDGGESENPPKESGDSSGTVESQPHTDGDNDGVTPADGDCDDGDPRVAPGLAEECDGVDNNCNGMIDEGMPDVDGDGTADCTDAEECDGVDNNGNGDIDEGFSDSDGDGTPDCRSTEVCDGVDNNGDGLVDEGFDNDGDGYTQCEDDCDDDDAAVNGGATETASNEVDDDCDGLIDEGRWASGDLVITEIMNNPGRTSDPDGEWFEVYNASDETLYLNGLLLESDPIESHVVNSEDLLVLPPGQFFVFGTNGDSTTNGGVNVNYVYEDVSLGNESDSLTLSAGDVILDSLAWDDGMTMPDPDGASLMVDAGFYNSTENDDPDKWCAATESWDSGDAGSPGAENELCSTTDHDGDGYSGDEGDCDDADVTVYPGAFESDPTKDNDCDGDIEWGPEAVATVRGDSSLFSCDSLYLDGSGSSDPDGGTLSYTWELLSAPGGSSKTTADIIDADQVIATFKPDVAGDYEFSLVVNDGGTNSLADTVMTTITTRPVNRAPVADAGAAISYSASASCRSYSYGAYYTCDDCADYDFSLSGLASTDADGDDLTYSWSVISGSYASLSSSSGESVTLTASGVPATYGSTYNDVTTVQLTVTDCMGESSTATVEVTYACTGS